MQYKKPSSEKCWIDNEVWVATQDLWRNDRWDIKEVCWVIESEPVDDQIEVKA